MGLPIEVQNINCLFIHIRIKIRSVVVLRATVVFQPSSSSLHQIKSQQVEVAVAEEVEGVAEVVVEAVKEAEGGAEEKEGVVVMMMNMFNRTPKRLQISMIL